MQESAVPNPETNRITAERELAEKRLGEIRSAIDTHVSTTPVEGKKAQSIAEDFGLDADEYTVFEDDLNKVFHRLYRFVPVNQDGDTLDGISYPNIGGPMHDLNRTMHHGLIYPNGDLAEKVTIENSQGITNKEFGVSASSIDPEEIARYGRFIRSYDHHVTEITQEPEEVLSVQREPRVEVAKSTSRGRRFLNLLGISNPK